MNSHTSTSLAESAKSAERPSGRLRKDLCVNGLEGAAFGGMVGLGETYFAVFALAIGLSELTAGMVSSVPLLAGGLMQTVSPWAVRRLGSHKRWVVWCAFVQSLVFVPLALAAWRGKGSIDEYGILALATLYWGSGLAGGPAWNTWIGALVPPTVRANHFAIRTRAQQAAVCCGVLGGGVCLDWASKGGYDLTAYGAMFAAAGLCRLVSVRLLSSLREPTPIPAKMRQIPLRQLLSHLRDNSGGRLLIYLAAVQASVQMAGPYFTPYMREQINLTYAEYVALLFVSFLTKAIALPIWGRAVRDIGTWRLLWIGGIGITPLSAGWIVSDHMVWLTLLQIFGGIAWAAYELAFFLLFF